MSANSAHKTQ